MTVRCEIALKPGEGYEARAKTFPLVTPSLSPEHWRLQQMCS